jgi:hypothetical protein
MSAVCTDYVAIIIPDVALVASFGAAPVNARLSVAPVRHEFRLVAFARFRALGALAQLRISTLKCGA